MGALIDTGNTNDSHHEISALKVIEYILYSYAIYSFWGSLYSKATKSSEPLDPTILTNILIAKGFFLFAFVLVIYRVYIDIHSIDYEVGDRRHHHLFVSNNRGPYRIVERIIRILIVCFVLLAPKSYPDKLFAFFRKVISSFQVLLERISDSFLYAIGLNGSNSLVFDSVANVKGVSHFELDSMFGYYATTLFIVGFLLLSWDLINAFSIQSALVRSEFEYNPRSVDSKKKNDNLYSYLDFTGVRAAYGTESVGLEHYDNSLRGDKKDPHQIISTLIKAGLLWWLYLRYSPRARERLLIIMFAFFTICYSRSNLSSWFMMAMAATMALFFMYAARDSRIKSGIFNQLMLPIHYFIEPQRQNLSHSKRSSSYLHRIKSLISGRLEKSEEKIDLGKNIDPPKQDDDQ